MKLSIIIVSYNTKKLLKACLSSFIKNLPKDYEVIVVDNASSDGSAEMVSDSYEFVKLIKSKENLGFAGGNNLGIKKSKGEYILLLNSDTETSPIELTKLVAFADSHKKAGIISPQLLNPDGSIQQNGGALPTLWNIFAWQFWIDEVPILTHFFTTYQREDLDFYTTNSQTGWVSGAAMLIRAKALEKLEVLDEKIFMYAEDVDICWRAKKLGWQVMVTSDAKVTHIGHASGDKSNAILGEYRGLKYVIAKHQPHLSTVINNILYYGALFRSLIFKALGKHEKSELYQKAARVVR